MGRRTAYTLESVTRALDVHAESGLIREWRLTFRDLMNPDRQRFEVTRADGGTLDLRSLREAYVFVNGLASAQQAVSDGKYTGPRGHGSVRSCGEPQSADSRPGVDARQHGG